MSKHTRNARKRSLLFLPLATLVATLVLALAVHGDHARAAAGPKCADAGRPPAQQSLYQLRTAVLCMVNRMRGHYHLRPLDDNPELRTSATRHSVDMVANHYFAHDGPHGGTVGDRVGHSGYLQRVSTYFVGENIGGGVGRLGSPAAVCRAWLHSSSHRANLLSDAFHDFGVGVARGFPGGGGATAATYTLDFGTRH